jgi:hypothetical protein
LLDKLRYTCKRAKPDAILIERATGQYLMAEFKMASSHFVSNHHKEDVDVLVCWVDDATDRTTLPVVVLALKNLLERGIREGEIAL